MDTTGTTFLHGRTVNLRWQYPLQARSWRRHLLSVPAGRLSGLQYRITYAGRAAAAPPADLRHDPTLVVEALDELHRSRQALFGVLAQLRGDEATEQVW